MKGLAAILFAIGLLGVRGAGAEPPVVRVSMENEPVSLDWNDPRSTSDRFIISFLMRGLLKYPEGAAGSGQPVCDLCTTYRVSPDGKVYRFELNPEEKWSDGKPLEGAHFVDSFRRLLDPANSFRAAEDFKIIAGAVQQGVKWNPKQLEIRAASKGHLEITLSRSSSLFPHLLTRVPAFPVRKDAFRSGKTSMASGPVLGPYLMAAWEKGKRLVIEGNPGFQGARPVYRVDFVFGSHGQLFQKFKNGRIDILSNPTTEDLVKLPGQTLQVSPYLATRLLVFNTRNGKPASSASLRRAILYSLDRESLPSFLKNGERATTGLIPPGMTGYRELPLATQGLERARAERSRVAPESKPIQLNILIKDTEQERAVAQWMGDRLSKINIRARILSKKSSSYYSSLDRGEFDLAIRTWVFDIASPLDILKSLQGGVAANKGDWRHVAYEGLLSELMTERESESAFADKVDRLTQIAEVQEVAVIPLGYPTQPFLLGPRVISFALTPFGDPDLVRIHLRSTSR